jgi:hypothetical protein
MESGLVGGQLTAPHRPTNIFNLANMVLKLRILVTSSQLTLKRHIRLYSIRGFQNLQPVLEAVSNTVTFSNLKAPVFLQLAIGSTWDEVCMPCI